MPYLLLPPTHYASQWSLDRQIRKTDDVTAVAVEYANEPNVERKKELLLELCRFFHSYVFKYVSMIVMGVLPRTGYYINSDVKEFLRLFLPAGTRPNIMNLSKIARTLSVAFKNMEVEEVYNVLEECLIRALDKYDPNYTDKVRAVVTAIDAQIIEGALFTSTQITERVGFQACRICKMLAKRGNLERVTKPNKPRIKYFQRADWPPSESLMHGKPIGLPYFMAYYFRHYLQQYITQEMRSLEARNTMMQLDYRHPRKDASYSRTINGELRVPSAEGELTDAYGKRWAADCKLMKADLDVTRMTLDWVTNCVDPLFEHLSNKERMFLYLKYSKELSQARICTALAIEPNNYETFSRKILTKLRHRVTLKAA